MWWSGTRVNARRPWSGPASSTTVPVSAMARAQPVTTLSQASSSAVVSGGSSSTRIWTGGHAASQASREPSGTSRLRASRWASRRTDERRQFGRRYAVHDGPVVGEVLGQQVDQRGRVVRAVSRQVVAGRSAAVGGVRDGGADAGEDLSRALLVFVVFNRGSSSTSHGTVLREAPAGRGVALHAPAGRSGASSGAVARVFGGGRSPAAMTAGWSKQPGGRLHRGLLRRGALAALVSRPARGGGPGPRGCRWRPGRPRSRRRTARRRTAARRRSRGPVPRSCGVRIAPIGPG